MKDSLKIEISAWSNGTSIPARYAFGKPGDNSPFALSENVSPAVHWSNPPEGTKSFVLICHDPDVPSSAEDVNQPDRLVPAELPRVPFYHWVLVNIPIEISEIAEGAASQGVTPRGKPCGHEAFGTSGQNTYTDWFAGDPDMDGTYGSYDGPCPPWNDCIAHRYYFTLYALDVEKLDVDGAFTGPQVLAAIDGHILASASHMGTYSMNPEVLA